MRRFRLKKESPLIARLSKPAWLQATAPGAWYMFICDQRMYELVQVGVLSRMVLHSVLTSISMFFMEVEGQAKCTFAESRRRCLRASTPKVRREAFSSR